MRTTSIGKLIVLATVACSPVSDLALAQRGPQGQQAQQAAEEAAAALLRAVEMGNAGEARALLKKGADANAAAADGTTALMIAVQRRDAEIVDALLDAGAKVSAWNRYGATPLHTAARNGDARITKRLLEAGGDPNLTLPEGETVLMTAALTGNVELIETLIAGGKGADPNRKEGWHGQTALMWAAEAGHADAIRALVAAGARVDEQSSEIVTPTVRPERRLGGFVYPNIPKGRMAALHFAARNGHLTAVRALIESGANINVIDAEGTNALILATLNGHTDVAAALLEAGADPNVADRFGRTVLFVATDMNTLDANPRPAPPVTGEKSYVDLVKLALAKGADPNARLKSTLPSWVAQGGAHNPYLRNGATAFMRAAMSADLTVMKLLLDAGADPLLASDVDDGSQRQPGDYEFEFKGKTTPLMAAAGVGWRKGVSRGRDADAVEAIKLLLARGARINEANQAGNTPLHGAAYRGSPAIVEFLLRNGANFAARNERGLTALDIALGQPQFRIDPNQAVAEVLQRHLSSQRVASR